MLLVLDQEHFSYKEPGDIIMDALLIKYNDYMRLENCKAEFQLSDGKIIEIVYKKENFAHLLGLHKLKDIQLIQFWLDKSNKAVKLKEVIRRIKNSTFTDAMVKASVFYPKIQDRYESFSYENLVTLTYTDAVINLVLVNKCSGLHIKSVLWYK